MPEAALSGATDRSHGLAQGHTVESLLTHSLPHSHTHSLNHSITQAGFKRTLNVINNFKEREREKKTDRGIVEEVNQRERKRGL